MSSGEKDPNQVANITPAVWFGHSNSGLEIGINHGPVTSNHFHINEGGKQR